MFHAARSARSTRVLMLSTAMAAVLTATQATAQSTPTEIDEIVVTGINLSVQKAIEEKRQSDEIQDSVSADDLGRLSNKNSSEAVARLPGVNISQDQGEGRYVSIRGASPNLNNVAINGIAVGSVEAGTRRIPLDIIGGELLGGIDVVKAVTPDLEANAIGGYINVKTPSPFDYKGDFFGRGTVQVGDQELDGNHPYAVTAMSGGKFGADQSIGALFGVSYADRHYFTKGMYADDWQPANPTNAAATNQPIQRGLPQSHKFNNYDLDRERLGLSGTIEVRPSDDAIYYVRGLWTQTDEREIRYRGRNYFARVLTGVTFNPDQVSGSYSNMRIRTELRDQTTLRRLGSFSAGGETTFDQLKVDYSASLIDNKLSQPTQVWTFQSADIFSGTFDMTPMIFRVTANGSQFANPANVARIGINAYSVTNTAATDKGYQVKANAKYDFKSDDFNGYLKAGAQFRSVTKTQDLFSDNYVPGTGGTAAFNVLSPGVWAGDQLQGKVDGVYYQVGPRLDVDGTEEFTASNLNNGAVLRRDPAASLAASTTSDFKTREQVAAGYGMVSATRGDWTLLGGVRLEHTDLRSNSFDLTGGTVVTPVSRTGGYTNAMADVHLRYNPDQGPFMLRAAWTNTIGRPEFSDVSGSRNITIVATGTSTSEASVSQGNPNLKAYTSRNFDVSAEYYFANGGIASVAGFYKDVNGFIVTQQTIENNVTLNGTTYAKVTTNTPINARNGTIKGVELNLQDKLTFLPSPFDGFGGGVSATFVDSGINVPGRPQKLKFVGQADKVFSAYGFYQKGPFEIVATYAWADNILTTIGATAFNDLYDKSYGRVDVKANYRVTPNINLFVEAQNLNDEPLGEFQGNPQMVTRSEVYGRTGYVGVSFNW
jgi:TonB-dependent receptor